MERRTPETKLIELVFERWRKYHPLSYKIPSTTSKEWGKIRMRLAEGWSLDSLLAAIDGMHKSPFHLGENDKGMKYLSLELCMRDGAHVERFSELAIAGPELPSSDRTQGTVRATRAWLERQKLCIGSGSWTPR